jgi:hypothetical protein
MGHAGADTLNVRDILVAEPHRVWFASRALLRGPLLRSCRQRRACEHETEKRKGCDWSQIQCGANSHPGPPLVRSASSITVNSTGVAITQQRMSGPLRPRPAPPHRGRAAARRARCSVAARPRRAARARPAAPERRGDPRAVVPRTPYSSTTRILILRISTGSCSSTRLYIASVSSMSASCSSLLVPGS